MSLPHPTYSIQKHFILFGKLEFNIISIKVWFILLLFCSFTRDVLCWYEKSPEKENVTKACRETKRGKRRGKRSIGEWLCTELDLPFHSTWLTGRLALCARSYHRKYWINVISHRRGGRVRANGGERSEPVAIPTGLEFPRGRMLFGFVNCPFPDRQDKNSSASFFKGRKLPSRELRSRVSTSTAAGNVCAPACVIVEPPTRRLSLGWNWKSHLI